MYISTLTLQPSVPCTVIIKVSFKIKRDVEMARIKKHRNKPLITMIHFISVELTGHF